MDTTLNYLIHFGIWLLILIISICILVFVARRCRIITVFFFYMFYSFLLAKLFDLLLTNTGGNEWVVSAGLFIVTLEAAPAFLYAGFITVITSLANVIPMDFASIADFLLNDIFILAFHGVLFILSALIFRKKKKKIKENSRYAD